MGTSIFNLPTALISLLLALPILAAPSSSNDPFHAIATHVVRKEEPPICCLRPLEPLELADEEILLSFDDWKKKQKTREKEGQGQVQGGNSNVSSSPGGSQSYTTASAGQAANQSGNGDRNGSGNDSTHQSPDNFQNDSTPDSTIQVPVTEVQVEKLSPHFRVPLTDRFNYASLDCSARVHTSHRSAKSPSSILSSKRDRYMLSPCVNSKESQFVVVELCEDIRIDTVQLANFEFFSGVFKDFSVSVAKTYIAGKGKEGWVPAGTYTGKNIRGVQSFHPPTSLRDFYRFIRIDFHSHYSNEYYCPISLLRVYGLTHLEEWKWDTWEAESQDNIESTEVVPEDPQPGHTIPVPPESPHGTISIPLTEQSTLREEPSSDTPISIPPTSSNTVVSLGPSVSGASSPAASASSTAVTSSSSSTHNPTTNSHPNNDIHDQQHPDAKVSETIIITTTVDSKSSTKDSNDDVSGSGSVTSSVPTTTITATASASSVNSVATRAMPPSTGGESIYRTIMNRLAAIETNQTLYAQYFSEQTCGVRDMLRKLGEDVGRLEGIEKAQAKTFQRNYREWEKQRRRLEKRNNELVSRVDYLSDEIILEKRLGIAQLCLLLTVLVFMAVTRGSPVENPAMHGPARFSKSSMREWSRRHLSLSFSGDWVSRLTSSRSRSPTKQRDRGVSPRPSPRLPEVSTSASKSPRLTSPRIEPSELLDFPSLVTPTIQPKTAPPVFVYVPTSSSSSPRTAMIVQQRPRSRTPSLRKANKVNTTPVVVPSTPPMTSRPKLKRANSHGSSSAVMLATSISWGGTVGPVPKSAKRWARSAHLHEVKGRREVREDRKENEEREREKERVPLAENPPTNEDRKDLFGGSSGSLSLFSPAAVVKRGVETDSDADVWEDTDIDALTSIDGDLSP
ncbi:hypothetical protein AAF712_008720 [Marasmius tenuissimus]|uniref:SUN domain-containing protein n=1 Tax=Marasmius tenuissimus TaxID=585030 RepID=A0ABR2ZT30_9AGAR